MQATLTYPRTTEQPGATLAFFRLLLPLFLAVRIAYAAKLLLVPDEAFYWLLSRHLAPGYLDHPPMIALVIWLGTHLAGSTELGVRIVGVLMAAGSMAIIVALAKYVLRDMRATRWVAAIWLTSPLLAGLGTISTPDTPATFFSVCALALAVLIADRDDQNSGRAGRNRLLNPLLWLGFGCFSGLAMDSKYTGVLPPAAVALAMLFSTKGRAHYRRPWIYLSGVVALIVFSPVIWWNYTHHWVSFLFQFHHGTVAADVGSRGSPSSILLEFFKDAGIYFGEQMGVWTPVLFGIAIAVLAEYWMRYALPLVRRVARSTLIDRLSAKRPISQVDRILLWSATFPLVLFGLANFRAHHTEANWPAFAYFPISLLIARWLSENWSGRRVHWATAGVRIALGVLIGMHILAAPPVLRALVRQPIKLPHAALDLSGWPQFGRWLGDLSTQTGAPIIANRHQDAGEASFYVPGQPDVWCVSIGSRPTAFDYFDEKPDFGKIPLVLWAGGHSELFCKAYGYVEIQRFELTVLPRRGPHGYYGTLLAKPQR